MKRNLIAKNQQFEIGNSSAPHSSRRSLQSLWTLGFSLSVLPLLARAERVYSDLPQLTRQVCTAELPSLSVIVPARNEAHNLRRLLPSLEGQNYRGEMEIIVVDDHSTDGTAGMVECGVRDSGCSVKLVCAGALPPGWLGKPHASQSGASEARGKWLLFTDADTEHEAFSAASAVTFAEAHGLDGLSIFPRQETRGLLDGVVLMVAFAGLFAGLHRSTSMLNGQYVLVRRDVYEASGGFAAVRSEMMDDLAYGNLLAEQGYKVPIMRGEALASVHMYDTWQQMWHGLTRLGSGSLRYNGSMALITAIFVTGVMMPLWTLFFNRHQLREIPSLKFIWLTAFLGFIPWAKRFNRKQESGSSILNTALGAMLAPVAAVMIQGSAVWGLVSRLLGRGVSWKNRRV